MSLIRTDAMNPKIVDLFCGAGGLSLGSHRAGFQTAFALDIDQILTSSYKTNFPGASLILRDLSRVSDQDLRDAGKRPDGVVGGPPCQAFSEIGRRSPTDPRRRLIFQFFRAVVALEPKFFVFENVRGLSFPENYRLVERGIKRLDGRWTILGPVILDSQEFGAPTRRKRLFLFGFDASRMSVPTLAWLTKPIQTRLTVRDAIADLSRARALGVDSRGFDEWAYSLNGEISAYAARMRSKTGSFSGHRKTIHTKSALLRFEKVGPGEIDKVGKYKRLEWGGVSPTLRAGTGNDRGSYQAVRPLHPTQNRVITPREAARLQGFPDSFIFHPTVWHSCRMIGNSVSPVLAERLLKRIYECL